MPLIDRSTYPEAEFPAGQWEYQLFYEENFDKARKVFEAETSRDLLRQAGLRGERQLVYFLGVRLITPIVLAPIDEGDRP